MRKQSVTLLALFVLLPFGLIARSADMDTMAKFQHLATQWEQWCEELTYDSDWTKKTKSPAFAELAGMEKEIVPLIFARWKTVKDRPLKDQAGSPPWWKLLQAVTKKQLVSDEEKLASLPDAVRFASSATDIELPALEEERWFRWWNTEGKKQFGKE